MYLGWKKRFEGNAPAACGGLFADIARVRMCDGHRSRAERVVLLLRSCDERRIRFMKLMMTLSQDVDVV
jgi:hypothetical protein